MSIAAPERLFTVEEFFREIPDGVKADLIDGVIYVASPDSIDDDRIGFLIRNLIEFYAQRTLHGGSTHGSRVAFVMGGRRAPEPDVSYVSPERQSILTRTRGTAAPDIAVEIVSTDSKERDYGPKKQLYQEAGVREYWIIDPLKRSATFYRLRNGVYDEVPLKNGRIFVSEVLPGFWLNTGWLFQKPLQDALKYLEQILAGQPN
jgi:Uma2 family endonuclease